MGWTKVEHDTWKPEQPNDSIEGVYMGCDESREDQHVSNRYYVKDKNNKTWLVWGCSVLDNRMKFVGEGSVVRIIYEGTGKNAKNQPMHLYSVFTYVQDRNSVPAPAPPQPETV